MARQTEGPFVASRRTGRGLEGTVAGEGAEAVRVSAVDDTLGRGDEGAYPVDLVVLLFLLLTVATTVHGMVEGAEVVHVWASERGLFVCVWVGGAGAAFHALCLQSTHAVADAGGMEGVRRAGRARRVRALRKLPRDRTH